MKKAISFLLISVCFWNCKEKKARIEFTTLDKASFNAHPFDIPKDQLPQTLKQAHDSCMGFSFAGNAIFVGTKDRYFVGNIVNKRSLQNVKSVNDLGLSLNQLIANFNIISK